MLPLTHSPTRLKLNLCMEKSTAETLHQISRLVMCVVNRHSKRSMEKSMMSHPTTVHPQLKASKTESSQMFECVSV